MINVQVSRKATVVGCTDEIATTKFAELQRMFSSGYSIKAITPIYRSLKKILLAYVEDCGRQNRASAHHKASKGGRSL